MTSEQREREERAKSRERYRNGAERKGDVFGSEGNELNALQRHEFDVSDSKCQSGGAALLSSPPEWPHSPPPPLSVTFFILFFYFVRRKHICQLVIYYNPLADPDVFQSLLSFHLSNTSLH